MSASTGLRRGEVEPERSRPRRRRNAGPSTTVTFARSLTSAPGGSRQSPWRCSPARRGRCRRAGGERTCGRVDAEQCWPAGGGRRRGSRGLRPATASPCRNAAMLATTPGLLAPCEAKNPIASQRCRSGSLVTMTWAHLRPGRFHAFEPDITVTACAAAASEMVAYGMWRIPDRRSGRGSHRRRRGHCSVADLGELGLFRGGESPAERVVGIAEDERVPRPGRHPRCLRDRGEEAGVVAIGTSMTRPGPSTLKNGMYAGVGRITGDPGREKCVMAISSALITSGT